MRVLFVANGHGETAIAGRIGADVAATATRPVRLDLFPLVGEGAAATPLHCVGPRRTMPSGGLVAMGNVRAFSADVRAGFFGLFVRQVAFLRTAGARYETIVAVGDTYALALSLLARRPTFFVGTAKSVFVAPYGPFERFVLRRATRIFVRDEATAARLRAQNVPACAPGNVIVDLVRNEAPAPSGVWLGLLPGSREAAYADAVRLARIVRALGGRSSPGGTSAECEPAGALLSIAPTLEARRFARELEADGWDIDEPGGDVPFEARAGATRLRAWPGNLGGLLRASVVVIGQAGTANEQAAAFGVPVVALQESGVAVDWYRARQRRLLGEALLLIPPEPEAAAVALATLLHDPKRLHAMGEAGRTRMGATGGARAIARAILAAAS